MIGEGANHALTVIKEKHMKILPKILVFMALALPIGAENLPVVTLDEALSSAEENNIPLQEYAVNLNRAIRSADNYLMTYLPQISLKATAGTGVSFPDATSNETRFDGVNLALNAGASFTYTLDGSKITNSETRNLTKEAATLGYEVYADSVALDVISSYWTLATYDIAVENAQASLKDTENNYNDTLEMYNSGMVDELTLSNMELALNNARIALQEAENDKALALSSFKAKTGITEDFQTEPLPETVLLSLPSAEELFAEYGEETSTIRVARNALRSDEVAKKEATLNQYMPTVSASVSYSYNGGLTDKTSYKTADHGLSGSVSLTIPLSSYIPGSAMDEARRSAEDDVTISALSLQDSQNTLLNTIRQNSITIAQQQSSLGMLEQSLQIAEKTYELAKESYEAGLTTSKDLAQARTDLLSAENSLLSARLMHLISSYNLASTLGIDLQELQETYPLTEKETI